MTDQEFTEALAVLGWKQSDLARRLDLDKNTPSRWANGKTPVPGWAAEYMRVMVALQRLNAEFVDARAARNPGAASQPDQAPIEVKPGAA